MKYRINHREVSFYREVDVDFKEELLRLQKVDWGVCGE